MDPAQSRSSGWLSAPSISRIRGARLRRRLSARHSPTSAAASPCAPSSSARSPSASRSAACLLWLSRTRSHFTTQLAFPFFKSLSPFLGWPSTCPFAALVLVAASNAVNLTDGLDGLATGSVLIAAGTYTAFAYLAGHSEIRRVPQHPVRSRRPPRLRSSSARSPAPASGFLWYNCHPAEVFMGDTGSLALGAAVGTVALAHQAGAQPLLRRRPLRGRVRCR